MLIPQKVLNVARAGARDTTRYKINAVQFSREEEGRAQLVATDGRMLCASTWDEDDETGFPDLGVNLARKADCKIHVSAKDVQQLIDPRLTKCAKSICQGKVVLEENGDGETARMLATTLEATTELRLRIPEGDYPDWPQVVPERTGDECVRVKLNIPRLRRLLQIMEDATDPFDGDTAAAIMDVSAKDPRAPIKLTLKGEKITTTGILMPMETFDE